MLCTQQLPGTFIGDITLAQAPGRGWALVATATIEPGDPILITPPLALLAGPPGRPPGAGELQALIRQARWLGPSRRLLEALSDGGPRAGGGGRGAAAAAPGRKPARAQSALGRERDREVAALMRQMGLDFSGDGDSEDDEEEGEEEGRGDRGRAPAAAAAPPSLHELAEGLDDGRREGQMGSRPPLRMGDGALARILQTNAYCDVWQDLPATTARREAPTSLAGVWPLFALLNHSCDPNAVHSVVGSTRAAGGGGGGPWPDALARPGLGPRMVVRAARRIPAGQEVVVNYLGRGALAPAEQRRAELASTWGFECGCPRCRMELALPAIAAERAESAALRAAELTPAVAAAAAALAAGAPPPAAGAGGAGARAELERAVRELEVELSTQVEAVAGAAYEAAHVRAAALMALDPQSAAALAALSEEASLAGALLPGSDLHTLTAARLAGALRAGPEAKGRRAQAAVAAALEAHTLRYGPLEMRIMRPLLEASIQWAARLGGGAPIDVAAAAAEVAAAVGGAPLGAAGAAAPAAAEAKPKRRGRPRKTATAGQAPAAAQQQQQEEAQREQPEVPRRSLVDELLERHQWRDPEQAAAAAAAAAAAEAAGGEGGAPGGGDPVARKLAAAATSVEDVTPEELQAQAAEAAAAMQEAAAAAAAPRPRAAPAAGRGGAGGRGGGRGGGGRGGGGALLSGASLPLLSRWMAGGTTAGSAAEGDGLTPELLNQKVGVDDVNWRAWGLPGPPDDGGGGGGGSGGSGGGDGGGGDGGGGEGSGAAGAAGPRKQQQQQKEQAKQQQPKQQQQQQQDKGGGAQQGQKQERAAPKGPAPAKFSGLGEWRRKKAAPPGGGP
ncbi:MAG: hypothetical protein J3K34DRAFT_498837 [Monoraphidium minutum]|nr:MAG: hypothetical protein J3K34DRAFT_498837 [Monoraphidium minutum]